MQEMLTLHFAGAANGAAWAEAIYTKRGQRYTFTKKQALAANQAAEFFIESATHVFLRVDFGLGVRRFLLVCPFDAVAQLIDQQLTASYTKALNPAQFCLKFVHVPNVFKTLQIGDQYKQFLFRQNPKQLIDGLLLANNICFTVSGTSLEVCNPQSGLYAIQAGSKTVYFELLSIKKDSVQTGEKNAEIIQLARKNENGGYTIDLHGQSINTPLQKLNSQAGGLQKSMRSLEKHTGASVEAFNDALPHFVEQGEHSVETASFSTQDISEPKQTTFLHEEPQLQRQSDEQSSKVPNLPQNQAESKPLCVQNNSDFAKQLPDQAGIDSFNAFRGSLVSHVAEKAMERISLDNASLQAGASSAAAEPPNSGTMLKEAQSKETTLQAARVLPPIESCVQPRRSTSTSAICEVSGTEICATALTAGNFSTPQKLSKLPPDFGFKGAEYAYLAHKVKPGIAPALMSVGRPNYALLFHSHTRFPLKKAPAEVYQRAKAPAEKVIRYSGFQNVFTGQTKLAGKAVDLRLVQNHSILSEKCRNLLLGQK